jgi:hypothetical protein
LLVAAGAGMGDPAAPMLCQFIMDSAVNG